MGILYAHQRGASLGRLVTDIELLAACCVPDELSNRVTLSAVMTSYVPTPRTEPT